MTIKNFLVATLLICSAGITQAQEGFIQTFNPGSLQQILRENAAQPFVLAIWSVDCPSCLKDMVVINEIRQKHPELKLIMLSTDEPTAMLAVKGILARNGLIDVENWIFGTVDAQKLRYEIDPSWYGELPRTYFYNATGNRTAKSGALRIDEFEALIAQIKP
ncbi:MAG: hypothetical protein CTY19_16075 [Methylomonas sp.]|nr:MAG: hypothetical protein CTY19_16075 [Methylomonas sp.]